MKRTARTARCYTGQPLDTHLTLELDKRSSHHLSTVLRAQEQQAICLFNGDGFDYIGTIVETGKKTRVEITEKNKNNAESPLTVQLVQAVARGEKMDSVIQKSTELGAACIQPVYTRHSIAKLDESRERRKQAHWQSIVLSACEQSGRAIIPDVLAPQSLQQFLDNRAEVEGGVNLILAPNAQHNKLEKTACDNISILVGPESGFDADEIDTACNFGYVPTQLGPRVMRTETAGPAAIAILQAQFGDMPC